MALRFFLGFSAVVWLPYGVFCFFQPGFLEQAAGVASTSATATTELRAMYGGLQAAIGSLAALAVFRPRLRWPALVMLSFLCAGLGVSRLVGATFDGEVSSYTAFALVFEFVSAGLAAWFVSRGAVPAAA